MNTRLALLALVTACWTEGPGPAPPPLRPEPVASATPAKPEKAGPRWRRSAARAPDPPPPTTRGPMEVARELTAELRAGGTHMLPSFIAGPIVVLDLDSGALSTLCDQAAISGTQAWGQMLVDPSRSAPSCRPGTTSYTCSQFSNAQMLIIELADPDAWRVVSVIVGNYRNGRTTLSTKMNQMRTQVGTATCP